MCVCVTCYPAGVKEIDIAATLEHVRDQRPGMVRTKVSQTRRDVMFLLTNGTLEPELLQEE